MSAEEPAEAAALLVDAAVEAAGVAAGVAVEGAAAAGAVLGPEDGLAASSFLGGVQMRLWYGQSLTCSQ